MDVVTSGEMMEREQAAMARGVTAEMLMERAGVKSADLLRREFPRARGVLILLGKGNNAGDGLVAARVLARVGWKIIIQQTAPEADWSELPRRKWRELHESGGAIQVRVPGEHPLPFEPDWIILDAMLGMGAKGPLKGEVERWVRVCNEARQNQGWRVAALDCPTGLPALADSSEGEALVADLTIAIGWPKDFLVQEEWSHYVGRLLVAPIFESGLAPATARQALDGRELAGLWPRRSMRSHKGDFGRVVVVGGSPGLVGAPILACRGALRLGAGLVHLVVPETIYHVAAAKAPDEVMVTGWKSPDRLHDLVEKADALVIGPGLGVGAEASLLLQWLLPRCQAPVVLDADGLNLAAQKPGLLNQPRAPLILTPHPGEMLRLRGRDFMIRERPEVALELAQKINGVVVLKGVRTLIAQKDHPLQINTTGNPGLARGGAGDVLSGMMAGLIAQRIKPWDAARLSVWLQGRAADMVLRETGVEETLEIARLPDYFSAAIEDLRWARI